MFPQPWFSHDAPCLQSATHRHPQHKYLLFYEYAEHLYGPLYFSVGFLKPRSTGRFRENPSLMPPGYTGACHLDKMFIIKMNRQSVPSQSILAPVLISSHHLFVAFNWGTLTPDCIQLPQEAHWYKDSFFLHLNALLFFDNSVHTHMHIQCIWSFSRIPHYPPHRPPVEPLLFPKSSPLFSCVFCLNFCFVYLCVGDVS